MTKQYVFDFLSSPTPTAAPTPAAVQSVGVALRDPTVVVEYLMTPEYAEQLLRNSHDKQRGIHWNKVSEYHKAMANGEWWGTHPDAISINSKLQVTAGQHRLLAVIRYGKPVRMTVAFDMPDRVPPTNSSPWRVSDVDVLEVPGSKTSDQPIILSIASLIVGPNTRLRDLPPTRYNQYSTYFQGGIRWISELRAKSAARPMLASPVVAVLAIAYKFNPEGIKRFTDYYLNGNTFSLEHPVNQLTQLSRYAKKSSNEQRYDLSVKTLRIVKAYFQGQTRMAAPKGFFADAGTPLVERSKELMYDFVEIVTRSQV